LQLIPITRLTAVLYGHFAVSGDREESPICCLCGFIAETDDWNRFDLAWRALLADSSRGFDAAACLRGTGVFQSWDVPRRLALLTNLSEILTRSGAVSMGVFVLREHFSCLSSADHAILAAAGVESALDLIFYELTERIIHQVHEESEKISLLLDQEPQSAAHRYGELFNKHVRRYHLGPHLMGALAFADAQTCSHLQAAKLLSEAVFLVQSQDLFPEKASSLFSIPPALQQIIEPIQHKGKFDAAELHNLAGRLKSL
jgi:hypothetical protein